MARRGTIAAAGGFAVLTCFAGIANAVPLASSAAALNIGSVNPGWWSKSTLAIACANAAPSRNGAAASVGICTLVKRAGR